MSQQINLFNPIFLKQKKHFSTVAMLQAFGLLLLGSVLVSAYASYQVSMLGKEAVHTHAQLADEQARLVKVSSEYAARAKSQNLEQQIKQTETEIQSLRAVFDVLQKGDIGNTKGYAEYLRAFARQIVDGVWLTGINLVGAGNEIGLEGRALQPELVPAYMNRLKREPLMQGKSFGTLEMQVPKAEAGAKPAPSAAPVAEPGGKDAGSQRPSDLAGFIEFRLQ